MRDAGCAAAPGAVELLVAKRDASDAAHGGPGQVQERVCEAGAVPVVSDNLQ